MLIELLGTGTAELLLYALFFMSMLFGGLSVVFVAKTPAITWLAASLKGRPIIAILRRDKKIEFKVAKYKGENGKVKGYGYYQLNPEGMYRAPGGVGFGIGLSDKAAILTAEFLHATQVMGAASFENYSEADVAYELSKLPDEEINKIIQSDDCPEHIKKYIANILEKDLIGEYRMKGEDKSLSERYNWLLVHPLVNFNVIRRFFKYNATPTAIHKTIEMEVANNMEKQNKGFHMTMNHVMMIVVLFIAAALCYVIIQSGGAGDIAGQAGTIGDNVGKIAL